MPPVEGVTGPITALTQRNERLVVSGDTDVGSLDQDGGAGEAALEVEKGKGGRRLGSYFVKTADHKERNRQTVALFNARIAKTFGEDVSSDVEKALAKTAKKGRSLTGRRLQHIVKPTLITSVKTHANQVKIAASLNRANNGGVLSDETKASLRQSVENIDKALSLSPDKKTQRALLIIKADINRELGEASEDPRAAYKPTKGLLKSRRGIVISTDPSSTRPTQRLAIKPDVAKYIASFKPGAGNNATDAPTGGKSTGKNTHTVIDSLRPAEDILQATGLQLARGALTDERVVELAGQVLRGDFSGVLARQADVHAQSQSALGENVERADALGTALQRRGSVVLQTAQEAGVSDTPEVGQKPATVHEQKAARIAQFVKNLQQADPITTASVKQAFLDNPEGLVELIVSKKTSSLDTTVPTTLPPLWRDAGISRELGVALNGALSALNLSTRNLGYEDISLASRQQTIANIINGLDDDGETRAFGTLTSKLSQEAVRAQTDSVRSLAAALVSAHATAQTPAAQNAQLSEVLQQHQSTLDLIKANPELLKQAGFGDQNLQQGLSGALIQAANLIAIPLEDAQISASGSIYSDIDLARLSNELGAAIEAFDFNTTAGLNLLKTVSDAIPDQGYFTAYLADVFERYGKSLNPLDKALLLSAHLSGSNPADGELGALKGTIKGAGPYLQKILQNLGDLIPDDARPLDGHSASVTPAAVKNVIASVKHELAPIDPKIRNSLLTNLALTSEAQVTALPELSTDTNVNTLKRHAVLRNVDRIGDYLSIPLSTDSNEDRLRQDGLVDAIASDLITSGVETGLSHPQLKEHVSTLLTAERTRAREAGEDLSDTAVLRRSVGTVASELYRQHEQLFNADWQAVQAQNANVISGIAFKSSLGAASVGETYLVDLTYKNAKEPVSAVIKLLRPGIAERAIREREVLSSIALLENEDGSLKHPGQKQTFAGIANQIDTELSLTREYDNVLAGQKYYANQHAGVEPVKLVAGVPRNRDALALELAPGKTLTDRLNQVRAYSHDTDKPFDHPEDFDPLTDTPKLGDQLLNTLSTWLFASLIDNGERAGEGGNSQGASGFYHGDLHGGNILYKGPSEAQSADDKGTLTLIDFGNAAHFPNASRKQLISLLSAPQNPVGNKGDTAAAAFDNLLSQETLTNVWNLPVGGEHGDKTARQVFISKVNQAVAEKGGNVDPFEFLQLVLDTANALNIERPAIVSNFARSLTLISQQLDDFQAAHAQAIRNYAGAFKPTNIIVKSWSNSVEDRVPKLPVELADPNSLSAQKLHTKNDWQFLNELDQLATDEKFLTELRALSTGDGVDKKGKPIAIEVGALAQHLLDEGGQLTPELFKERPELLNQFVVAYLHHANKLIASTSSETLKAVKAENPELAKRDSDEITKIFEARLRTVFTDQLTPGILELAHDNVLGAQFARDGYVNFEKQYNLKDRNLTAPATGGWAQEQMRESASHFDFSGTLNEFFTDNQQSLLGILIGTSTGHAPRS